ncbi:unnamed protein product [Rotaria sp. Silwood2]|nr:unnamed protein product [Rotaria sp. Silwood2]
MTENLYDQFLSLFKKTGSDVNQRQQNYVFFLQSAILTNEQYIKNVIQWIEKRFTNEQLIVIENFLNNLSSYNMKLNFQSLINNFDSIESIINIAINHLQQSTTTLRTIISYGSFLLKSIEYHPNKQTKELIQQFATKIIRK